MLNPCLTDSGWELIVTCEISVVISEHNSHVCVTNQQIQTQSNRQKIMSVCLLKKVTLPLR